MRSLRLHGTRDLKIHNEPIPEPARGEVRVRVRSVGICASDLHYYRDGKIGTLTVTKPLVLGHEASGVVDALGEGVSGLAVGDRVAIEPAKPCMECEYCRSGQYHVCPGIPFMGTPPTDGALCDYVAWPARLVAKAPDSLSFDEIACIEPMAIGLHAMNLANLRSSDVVAVLGAGAIGLSVLQAVRIAGVRRIIVSEPVEARRIVAMKLGADAAVDPTASALKEEIGRLTEGHGANVVFECAGEEETVRESCRIAAVHGKVVVVGIPDGNDYPFEATDSRRKELTAVFVRRSNLTTHRAIELALEGEVDLACYATHRFALEETRQAMELAISKRDGVVRAIIAVSS